MLRLRDLTLHPDQKIVRADEYQAYVTAEGIIENAKRQADQILVEARAEFHRQQEKGVEEGLLQGRLEMSGKMIDAVTRTVDYFSEMEQQVVNIVMKSLRRILGEMDDRELVVKVVRNALAIVRTQAKVMVRVSPTDVDAVRQRVDDITRPYPGIQFIEVVSDSRLKPGGCVLETDLGVVDASVDGQLKALESSLSRSIGASHG